MSTTSWQPVERARTYELVIAAIEQQIMTGALGVGDPLPPERELAATLQVSRAGVREALRVLEGHGVLRSQVGAGAEAGTFVAALPASALARFLRLHVALANFPLDDVVEARIVLERSSARFAAAHADADHLAAMRAALARMAVPGVGREEFNDADTDFHVAIAEAGGNRLVADMTLAIRDSLRGPLLDALRQVTDFDAMAATLRMQHEDLYAAIEAGDGDRAEVVAEHHIRDAHAALHPPSTLP